MTRSPRTPDTLAGWLAWMETLHPRAIDLGLGRAREVAVRMDLESLPFPVVTVAGTNGKGSTVAMLEAMLHAAGYRVGSYTSPHLLDYNERVRMARVAAGDAELCAAFEEVESNRGQTSLTYFEFGTLAAAHLLRMHKIDIAVLEVGLGGRLDAVNLWDADVAVISSIGIDHTDWLGPDRESIGREKAGIFRAGRSAVCSDPAPPATIAEHATAIGAELWLAGRDFGFETSATGWAWNCPRCGTGRIRAALPYPAMRGDYQLYNASGVLMALELLAPRFTVSQADVRAGLQQAVLPGRFQTLPGIPVRVLDVAHNAQAARSLASTLASQNVSGKTLAVVGMLRDKPMADVLAEVSGVVDVWHLATLDTPRGASAEQLYAAMSEAGIGASATLHPEVVAAYSEALRQAGPEDRIVVFGSFHTVGAILRAVPSSSVLIGS
ncbi:MAG: bifunctional tetrahydrofolate synthase/dihydrofolate synthase [Acidiferrobacterales bacterium]